MILDAIDTPVCNIFDKLDTATVRKALRAHVTASPLSEEEAVLEAYSAIFEAVSWNDNTENKVSHISVDPLKGMLSVGFPLGGHDIEMGVLYYPLKLSVLGIVVGPVGHFLTLVVKPKEDKNYGSTHKINSRLLPNEGTAISHFNRVVELSPDIHRGVLGSIILHGTAPTLSDVVLAVEEEEDTL